jgi:tetratricopeptide (TPR) repeat protein
MVIGRAALAMGLLAASSVRAGNRTPPPLTATAQASTRPRECSPSADRSKGNVWDAVRDPNLGRYCDLVARALGQLRSSPADARALAEMADGISFGHAAPAVVSGRALAASGSFEHAVRAFERARQIDPGSLHDPETMRDWARALGHVGRAKEALDVYRALASRSDLLPDAAAQVGALLEAAELSFSVGPEAIDDAIAFLREARRVPAAEVATRVLAELALALERRAMTEEASSIAIEARRRMGQNADAVAGAEPGAEPAAAVALVSETTDRSRAIRGWEMYLQGAGGKGPWAAQARSRLDALRRQGRKGGR